MIEYNGAKGADRQAFPESGEAAIFLRKKDKEMDEERDWMMPEETAEESSEVTAQELGDVLGEEAQENEQDSGEALAARIREGISMLFEDGWTIEELKAFSLDALAQNEVAQGKDVLRAACGYLRRSMKNVRRRGVPTMRTTAAGIAPEENRIERMSDEQFAQFSRRAHAAMMRGERVRL